MGDFEEIAGDVVNPIVDTYLAAGRARTGFAGERDTTLVSATRADTAGITGIGIAAGHETLDDLSNISTLIWGNFVFQAQVTPVVPVVAEDLSKTVVSSGMVGLLPRR